MYVTGAVGVSWLRGSTGPGFATPAVGVGLSADAGKEWWVSDRWGLGVAARFWFTHTSDRESSVSTDYDMTGVALLFTATYQ
jgi:hypothetical protein